MRTRLFFFLLSINILLIQAENKIKPCFTNQRCEHLENPIGIDNLSPRFSWQMKDNRQGAHQTYYRIYIGTDSIEVAKGKGKVWDSGKIKSNNQLVTYTGKPLAPFTRYYWNVEGGDMHKEKLTGIVQSFETGMLSMDNWEGAWIGDGKDINFKPAPYFRKQFTLQKPVQSARAYIAVAGLYELHLNGKKVGDHILDPMYTRFDRRNLYVCYDITPLLHEGDNAVGVLLGNGWYNHQSLAVWNFHNAPWRNRPAFCMDIRITYNDGKTETIPTDLSWRTSSGPLLFNSIYTGEHYDARLEMPGWDMPNFDDSKWNGVSYRSVPSQHVTAQQLYPIRKVEKFTAQSMNKLDEKTYVFDFGQNMSGVTRIQLCGEPGTVVRIKHGERLGKNQQVDLSNINVYYTGNHEKEPFQTDILTLSGNKDEFTATFNYKGFRYVEVSADKSIQLTSNSLTAFFIHSDVPAAGTIHSSSDLINKLWKATNYAYLSNLMGYPTDCPQREKNGWTGDGHLAIETALYNYDGITIYEKWLADHRDEQQPNGVLPDIIPTSGWGYGTENGLDWTSTIAIIPWNLYLFYGDSKPLADCYNAIKRYVNYVERISNNYLTTWGRGDWVPVKSHSNKELTSSVYFYVDTQILAYAAKLFGKQEDYEYYTNLAEQIRQAINNKFLNTSTGIYANGTQTEQSVPLMWGIVPEESKAKVAANLAKEIEKTGFHLDVGVLGAKAILNALCENGHFETAYKVAVQNTYPSWGWWIANGSTTLLENWDLNATRDISDNHMMFGEIGGWFFKGIGGIYPDPLQPGFKHILLRPNFTRELKHFEATHNAPQGKIVSQWKWEQNKIQYKVIIPPNCTATLQFPIYITNSQSLELEAGTYEWTLSFKEK